MTCSAAGSTRSTPAVTTGSPPTAPTGGTAPDGLVVLPVDDLDEGISRYRRIGFVLDAIGPADDPSWARLSIDGLRIELDSSGRAGPEPHLRVHGVERQTGAAPDGVELAEDRSTMRVPPTRQSLAVTHETADGWGAGRAGMLYRDLIPDRYGGAYIASHIHVPDGGPVPDYVHHHDIAYQLIFCHRGWVRVVYQDQGPPFVMEPGDCVLQPPGIRHRVLEASDHLFVTEITCPAVHTTWLDHELALPNDGLEPGRRFGGQRFVRHDSSEAHWEPLAGSPFHQQLTGVAAATDALASVRLLRTAADTASDHAAEDPAGPWPLHHDRDLYLLFVAAGGARLVGPGPRSERLSDGSSVAVPAGREYAIDRIEPGTLLLELSSAPSPIAG